MTVRDVYIMGAALIGDHEGDDPDEELFAIPYMNILLQESLACENSIRMAHGETELSAAPVITSIETDLEYHDQLVRAAFPYGLAWLYQQEAGNHGLAAQYRNMFIDAVNGCYCYSMRKYR